MTIAAPLDTSAQLYRKKLLRLPAIGIAEALAHMTPRPGVRYKETVGWLTGSPELRPYDGNMNGGNNIGVGARTLETFFGSMVELFDPNSLRQTIYGQNEGHADQIKDSEMNLAVLMKIMKSVMNKLNGSLFSAVRNGAGTTTADLFNGFDTITAAEIAAAKIALGLGNYATTAIIDSTNAVDELKAFYRKASAELKGAKSKLVIPYAVKEAYDDDYQATVGAVPYNREFNKTFLEGSNNLCELVPLTSKAGSSYIHLTTKENMLYGYGGGVESEKIEVRRGDNPFLLQFILTMFFGVQFEYIGKENLMVGLQTV